MLSVAIWFFNCPSLPSRSKKAIMSNKRQKNLTHFTFSPGQISLVHERTWNTCHVLFTHVQALLPLGNAGVGLSFLRFVLLLELSVSKFPELRPDAFTHAKNQATIKTHCQPIINHHPHVFVSGAHVLVGWNRCREFQAKLVLLTIK